MDLKFELVTDNNAGEYSAHKKEVVVNSGVEGNPIYNPYSQEELKGWKWPIEVYLTDLKKPLNEIGWKRSWAVMTGNEIVASLDLLGSNVPSGLHRCILMMGVVSNSRKLGIGRKIISFAAEWAKGNSLKYIDLGVFNTNVPAFNLYKSFGFEEIGRRKQAFIVSGTDVDDIQMTYLLNSITQSKIEC